jgi:hypothetical protein
MSKDISDKLDSGVVHINLYDYPQLSDFLQS